MPILLNNNSTEKKNGLSTLADAAGGAEIALDVTSLYGPASMVASPLAAIAGTVKDLSRYFNDKQSGLTTAANISNHIGWGLLGMIPEIKGVKLLGKAGKAAKTANAAGKATTKNSDELLKAYQQAEAKLAEAKKGTPWYKPSNTKALEEEVRLAKQAYEQSKGAVTKSAQLQALLAPRTLTLGLGRTATSGAMTYGLPGMEKYIAENSDDEFTPGSTLRAIGYGAIGNGFSQLGEDIQNAPNDWDAASRLAGVFIQPHNKGARSPRKKVEAPKTPTRRKTTTKKKQEPAKQEKPKVDYAIQPEIPGRKLGGKIKYFEKLRNI